MSIANLILVACGGALGSVVRVMLSAAIPAGRLPWGTLTANVLGSCAIGWLIGRLGAPTPENARWYSVLVVGFCGGFTTFSAFSVQLYEQLRAGQLAVALVHALVAVATCVAATALGWRLGRL